MPIAEFFARFRRAGVSGDRDPSVFQDKRPTDGVVIATGGGPCCRGRNWNAWRPESVVLGLTADPATLVERIRAQTLALGDVAERPLLVGDAVGRCMHECSRFAGRCMPKRT